jgi:hypothetical protein
MNFIASVVIAVMESEEFGFLVFMHLILNRDVKNLFLPVSFYINLDRVYQSYT